MESFSCRLPGSRQGGALLGARSGGGSGVSEAARGGSASHGSCCGADGGGGDATAGLLAFGTGDWGVGARLADWFRRRAGCGAGGFAAFPGEGQASDLSASGGRSAADGDV